MKKDALITASSLTPEPDAGCFSLCYYGGWDFDHTHTPAAAEAQ